MYHIDLALHERFTGLQLSNQLSDLLNDLRQILESQQLWQQQPPSQEALASEMPFCYDTMAFPEWVQWLFIPKLQALAAQPDNWPPTCAVAPMAEEYFKALPEVTQQDHQGWVDMIAKLREIDALITERG